MEPKAMQRTRNYQLELKTYIFKVWPPLSPLDQNNEPFIVEVEAKHERIAKAQMQRRWNCYEFNKVKFVGAK